MEQYLVDTNVLPDYISNRFNKEGIVFFESLLKKSPTISFITQIEILSWVTNSRYELIVKELLDLFYIIGINSDIINLCVEIRREYKLKTPDAIIAASCIHTNSILITNNTKDFIRINNLKIINIFDL